MRTPKYASYAAGMLVAVALFFSATHAQNVSNQATQITFEQPVRVPGQVLPPGTYWFTVLNSGSSSDLNRVQIKNADGTKVIAQLQTGSADHAQFGQTAISKTNSDVHWPTGKVVLTFAEGGKNEPISLMEWFYPGRTDGHRFVYKDREEKEMSEAKHQTLAFNPGDKITIGKSQVAFQ